MGSCFRLTGVLGLAIVNTCLIIACSGKGSNSPDHASPSSEKIFHIEQSDESKLQGVNCKISDSDATCEDIPVDYIDDALVRLKKARENFQKQKTAIDEVAKSISERLNASKFEINSEVKARVLIATLITLSGKQVNKAAEKDVEISNEMLFQTVTGYKCNGSIKNNNSLTRVDESMIFSDTIPFEKTIQPNPQTPFSAALGMKAKSDFVDWKFSESQDSKTSLYEHAVQINGEFGLKIIGASDLELQCLKTRASVQATQITDRPVQRRYLKCNVVSVIPHDKQSGMFKSANMNLSFNVSTDDDGVVTELAALAKDDPDDSDLKDLKFALRVKSTKGNLTFSVYDQKIGNTVLELKTVNSTKTVSFRYLEEKSFGIKAICGEGAK